MCKQKGNAFCSELGEDVAGWSKHAPLAKPAWIGDSFSFLMSALALALEGKVDEARLSLKRSPDEELRSWFDVHAQNTGTWRFKALGVTTPEVLLPLDPVKFFAKFEVHLFARDNYRCRYCQSRVVPAKVLRSLQKVVGEEFIPLRGTNSGRSGFYLMFCATLDHVLPHSVGGRTDENNLVTCCWSCNYGKTNYTLEQLGLDDPFSRPPSLDKSWQGLVGIL